MRSEKISGKASLHSQKQVPSSSHRKSRWESNNDNRQSPESKPSKPSSSALPAVDSSPVPSAIGLSPSSSKPIQHDPLATFSLRDHGPPAYGFHMLERRSIVLADGSVRSYFALPPDDSPNFPHLFPPSDKLHPFGIDRHYQLPGQRSPDPLSHDRVHLSGRGGRSHDYWNSLGLDGRGPHLPSETSQKRKYGDEDGTNTRDDFARQRQQLLQYGNPNPNGYPSDSGDRADYLTGVSSPRARDPLDSSRPSKQMKMRGDGYDNAAFWQGVPANADVAADAITKHLNVDPQALKRSFLRFSKMLNEYASQRKNYLENGKNGALRCLACDRDSKEYSDVHALIMHAYNSQNAALRVDHLGLHKALCVLMGWNYAREPDSSKTYQSLPANDASANLEDLIIWPPIVIIHNTNTGRKKDGRVEGLGNKEMDNKLKELGFGGGKSKSMYGRDGHLGITVVKFASSQAGLKEAEHLAGFFEKENHGRRGWERAQASQSGDNDESNPDLVKVDEKSGEKKRIFYGYLGTASDLDKVEFDMKKKAMIKSRREFDLSD